jgi:hypothetical protein
MTVPLSPGCLRALEQLKEFSDMTTPRQEVPKERQVITDRARSKDIERAVNTLNNAITEAVEEGLTVEIGVHELHQPSRSTRPLIVAAVSRPIT